LASLKLTLGKPAHLQNRLENRRNFSEKNIKILCFKAHLRAQVKARGKVPLKVPVKAPLIGGFSEVKAPVKVPLKVPVKAPKSVEYLVN
jgi:phosphoribosylcarboxyaminoimidazole (NCAIR) mutase